MGRSSEVAMHTGNIDKTPSWVKLGAAALVVC